jgi:hypothetical protein
MLSAWTWIHVWGVVGLVVLFILLRAGALL